MGDVVPPWSGSGPSLRDVRVLEFSDGRSAGALAGRLLADLGARVEKIERAGGDTSRQWGEAAAESLMFGKETSEITPADARISALVAGSDVVIVDQWWLAALRDVGVDPRAWRADRPELVVALTTSFGADGPWTDRSASELVMQAEAGIVEITGHPDSAPVRAGFAFSAGVGALISCGAVLAVLYPARANGHGATIDVAEFDAMVMMQGNFLPGYLHSGRVPSRVGNVQPLSAPWNSYPTTDGEVVVVAISESLWQRLLTVIGRADLIGVEEFIGKSNRVRHREEIDAMISGWTSQRTAAQVAEVMTAANIPAGEVRPITALLADDFVAERELVRTGQHGPVAGALLKLADLGKPGRPVSAAGSAQIDGAPGKPLAGLRVLEIGGHTAGGMATRMMGDLGAEVIKVELPQGDNARTTSPILSDGNAYLWHFWNVGKHSVVLNFAEPAGYQALLDLVATSDVVLENMAVDTVEKLRIGHDDLSAVNPRLVYCSVSGFGSYGAKRYHRAFDSVLQAEGGLMSVTGAVGGRPVKAGPSVVDNATALAAVAGTMAALHRRSASGAGVLVDGALFDTAVWLTAEWWPLAASGQRPEPVGNRDPNHPLYNGFVTADDKVVAITASNAEQEQEARQLFDLPAERDQWDDAVAGWVGRLPAAAVIEACVAAGLGCAAFNGIPELVAHPLVAAREMLPTIGIGVDDECRTIGTPYKFLGEAPMLSTPRRVPGLGEHTVQVLTGVLGYDEARTRAVTSSAAITRSDSHR